MDFQDNLHESYLENEQYFQFFPNQIFQVDQQNSQQYKSQKKFQLNSSILNSQNDQIDGCGQQLNQILQVNYIQKNQHSQQIKYQAKFQYYSSILNSKDGQVDGLSQDSYKINVYDLEGLNEEEKDQVINLIKKLYDNQSINNQELKYTLLEQINQFFKVKNYLIKDSLEVQGNDIFFTATKIEKDGVNENAIIQFIHQKQEDDQNIQNLIFLKDYEKDFIQLIDNDQKGDIQVLILQNFNHIEHKIIHYDDIEIIQIILKLLQGFIFLEIKSMLHPSKKPLDIFIDDDKRLYINFEVQQQKNQIIQENISQPNSILEAQNEQQGNQNNSSNQSVKQLIKKDNNFLKINDSIKNLLLDLLQLPKNTVSEKDKLQSYLTQYNNLPQDRKNEK
ncbi:hypothetical protein ABPG72_008155 [Tetrahymena utriculariae]